MILKVVVFMIATIVLYKFIVGRVSPSKKKVKEDKRGDDFTKIDPTSECSECGTYMTEDDAIIYQRKSFCSHKCLTSAQKR